MLFISLYMIGMYKETTSPSHICFGSRRQWLPLSECSRCRTYIYKSIIVAKHQKGVVHVFQASPLSLQRQSKQTLRSAKLPFKQRPIP